MVDVGAVPRLDDHVLGRRLLLLLVLLGRQAGQLVVDGGVDVVVSVAGGHVERRQLCNTTRL